MKCNNVGETITRATPCMSNMGRRSNNWQLPASPLIIKVKLKWCSTAPHAAGVLISKGNTGHNAWTSFYWLAENMRKESVGSKRAVSAGVMGTAASPPLGTPSEFLGLVL